MMKKMKLIALAVALFAGVTGTFAQGFGVKGSFNFFNLTQENSSGSKIENKMIPTFDAGIFYEISVAPEFYLRPELLFAQKGAKNDNKLLDFTAKLSYVELPVLFLYKGGLGNNHILLGFGPYVAKGVGGSVESKLIDGDVKFKNDITDAEDLALYCKPIDFGGKVMAGYEFGNGLSFALNASLGLIDIEPKVSGKDLESFTKNNGFGLTVGYRFGSK